MINFKLRSWIKAHRRSEPIARLIFNPTSRRTLPPRVRLFPMNLRLLQLCLLLCMLSACVTETKPVQDPPRNDDGTLLAVLAIPQQMQDVSGDLLRYHAKYRALPAALQTLVDDQVISAERFVELPDYAYHPRGLGKLRDGRVVILVDAVVRIEGHAWCIVREPTNAPRSIQLNVTPVSLQELEAAAR